MAKTPLIDFNQTAVNLLPPSKRKPFWIAWIQGISSQAVRLNWIFYKFMYGNDASYWDGATSYSLDDEVTFNYKVYKSLTSSNLNNNPESSSFNWELIASTFIGTIERFQYNSQKIVMEYALNRYFQKQLTDNGFVGFIQPNSPTTPTPSDIYITNISPAWTSFVSFTTVTNSSASYTNRASAASFTNTTFTGATSYQFAVNIPSTVYSSINSDPLIAESVVRGFLDKLVPSGIFYSIITY